MSSYKNLREIQRKNEGQQEAFTEMKGLIQALQTRDAELKAFCEKASQEIKTTGAIAADTKGALELLAKQGNEMQARLIDLEQKAARMPGAAPVEKSWGDSVIGSAGFKSVQEGVAGRSGRIEVKAVSSLNASAGVNVETQRLPGILAPQLRPLTIRDLIMPGRTGSNSIEYVQELLFTNNAASFAEAAQRPESDITFELKTGNVRSIGHFIMATKEILADAPQLASYIDGRLRYGLAYVEDNQLLNGNGTGTNLLGLIPQATDYNTALNAVGDTPVDTIRNAILQVRLAEYAASGIVLHPSDWKEIESVKTQDGAYIMANPAASTQPRLWGLPVVETTAMTQGRFMVGAFNMAAQIFDRENTTVEVSTEDRDNFVKGMVTIKAEERLALAVYRPQSFVEGAFP